MKTKLTAATAIVALVFAFGVTGCSDDDTPSHETSCVDGIDNDMDGLIDCADSDCVDDAMCYETSCTDGVDNDMDGLTDCDDSDCDQDAACQGPECGDNVLNGTEECDNTDFGTTSCQSLGFDSGTLSCTSDCLIDDSGCTTSAVCGDDTIEGNEECEPGDGQTVPPDFGGATCADYGFAGGSLSCDQTACTIDSAGCHDVLATCTDTGSDSLPIAGQITCADDTGSIEWDWYTVTVAAGDCVHIKADNGAGAADLLAFAIDADGATMYGLASDWSELDDELQCSTTPWAPNYGCPEASVTAATAGDMTIAVGQWGGGCASGMSDYTLFVAVNSTDASPTLAADDTPMQ